ncbi:MAG: hypothetical protein GX749_03005 [Ruminococcaceae bacterium]|nr:hypothetical protein [Oscillospiraceae bacterium]
MTNKKTFRTPLILLIAAIMTLSLASGTMAKYLQTVRSVDTARVAQFQVDVLSNDARNGVDDQTNWTSEAALVNLLSTTIDDTGIYNENETDFDRNGGVKLVAPGSNGSFQINVDNKSEVAVKTSFAFSEIFVDGQKIPLVYTFDSKNYSSYGEVNSVVGGQLISGSLADLGNAIAAAIGEIQASNGTTAVAAPVQNIGWSWAFTGSDLQTDLKDTALAVDSDPDALGQPTITLAVTCTVEQLDTYTDTEA